MKQMKSHKLVMLPTEKADNCITMYYNGKISWTDQLLTKTYRESTVVKVFHLYILSKKAWSDGGDIIKHGDWFYSKGDNKVFQYLPIDDTRDTSPDYSGTFKVVATTDKSIYNSGVANGWSHIETSGVIYLPQIPKSFIQAYIKSYNEGNTITEVSLEMEKVFVDKQLSDGQEFLDKEYTIKTREDNTVMIHQSRTYTREEVIKFIKTAVCKKENAWHGNELDKWIEDNLK
jgi:hypothetical protein